MNDTSPRAPSAEEALDYPFTDYPPERGAIEVADGIFWLSTPLPFAGLRQVNLWLLRDGDGWTMVDCGYGYEAARATIDAVWHATLQDRPITRLVVTHFHPDHAGNSGWIAARWGIRPVMTQGEWFSANLALRDRFEDAVAHRVAFFRAHGLDEARIEVFAKGAVLYAAGVGLPPAFTRVRDGDALAIGGDRWTVVTGEGHSPEHAALYCAARKILISGDQVLPTITTNISVWPTEPDGDPLGLFLETGRRLAGLLDPATFVLPSHRKPFRNVHRRLAQLAHHHEERLDLILRATDTETSAAALIDVMFQRTLDGHQMGFAMGEAIAHLNHLVTRGRMERMRDEAGTVRYRKRG
ncbi:MAG TPA: MBL fold metallo-hydrolase [Stellaceae bacterium]|nr:MBL fold metallo-hydrolase [Stellaceae bacterium]